MDKDSEVTADGYRAERKAKKDKAAAEARYRNKLASISAEYSNRTSLTPEEIAEIKELERQARLERDREIAEIEKGIESIRKYEEYAKTELASQYQLINSTSYIPEKEALKARDNFLRRNIDTTKEYKEGTKKVYRDAFKEEFKDNVKEGVEGTVEYEIVKKVVEAGSIALTTVALFFLHSTPAGGGELLPNEIKTKRDPRKIITPATYGYLEKRFPEYIKAKGNEYTLAGNYKDAMILPKNQGEKIDKVIFADIKNFYYGTKTLDDKISESDGKFYGSLIGSTFGVITTTYTIDNLPKVLDSTLKGGNISSISKTSYKTENTSLALYDKSKIVETNGTLVAPLTTNKELATVSLLKNEVNKVSQIQNNRLPYKPVLALPNYLSKPEQGGIMVVGAGTKPISGAYNIDINPKVGSVHYGDATNLVNVPTGSQAKVIIENPFGFDPTNSEILRVLQKGGELRITGTERNRYFKNMLKDSYKPPKGFKVIKKGDIPELERRQGFQKNGEPIGKPTDKEVILIKE